MDGKEQYGIKKNTLVPLNIFYSIFYTLNIMSKVWYKSHAMLHLLAHSLALVGLLEA